MCGLTRYEASADASPYEPEYSVNAPGRLPALFPLKSLFGATYVRTEMRGIKTIEKQTIPVILVLSPSSLADSYSIRVFRRPRRRSCGWWISRRLARDMPRMAKRAVLIVR